MASIEGLDLTDLFLTSVVKMRIDAKTDAAERKRLEDKIAALSTETKSAVDAKDAAQCDKNLAMSNLQTIEARLAEANHLLSDVIAVATILKKVGEFAKTFHDGAAVADTINNPVEYIQKQAHKLGDLLEGDTAFKRASHLLDGAERYITSNWARAGGKHKLLAPADGGPSGTYMLKSDYQLFVDETKAMRPRALYYDTIKEIGPFKEIGPPHLEQ